jgi:hypothetical protein
MGEYVRIDLDDVDPEVDPPLNEGWLPVLGAGQIAGEVVDEVRLPLELGINPPHHAEDDAQDANPLQAPGRK